MSTQSKFFQVTNQILLNYRTDQYKIMMVDDMTGADEVSYYMYQGDDGNQYYVETQSVPYQKYPNDQSMTFYYGGNGIKALDVQDETNSPLQSPVVGSDIYVNDRNVGVVVKSHRGEQLRRGTINHDTIRLYILTGYVMNNINGYSLRVKARVTKL